MRPSTSPGGTVLDLRVDHHADEAVVRLRGELDIQTSIQLRRLLCQLIAAGDRQIVLDLSDLGFIDSAGLGVLVGGLKRARQRDGDLTLACPRPVVANVLDMTGLSTVFEVLSEAPIHAESPSPT